jgi:hypothetical protein
VSAPFFPKPPQTITREEAERIRRESKDHIVVVQGNVALHMVRGSDGVIYVVDEAKQPQINSR